MFFLEISTFFGRFHPLLVHLPIGFLILAVLISIKQKDKNLTYTKILRLIWFLAFISSFFSAIMGLLLAENGHYIENDLSYIYLKNKTKVKNRIILLRFSQELGWCLTCHFSWQILRSFCVVLL